MKIIFLDIDGVLNDHRISEPAGCYGINPECMKCLNMIIQFTKANLVISSAWRYMITGGSMTLSGFEYMLRTHGLDQNAQIVGHTKTDEEIASREGQIKAFIDENNVQQYVILDDMSVFPFMSERFYKTNSKFGLTKEDVDNICAFW